MDLLRENEVPMMALNAAAASGARDKTGQFGFYNLRAEMTWKFRERLDPLNRDEPIALPPDPKLAADLCAMRYQLTSRGYKIESKDDIRQRIGRSPDDGDAVIMAAYADHHAKARKAQRGQRRVRRAHEDLKRSWGR